MKRLLVFSMACLLVLMSTSGAFAEKKEAKETSKPGAVVVDVVAHEATVDAIDYQKRTVTLKGADGKTKTFKVGKEVRNFDQIKKGDKVKAETLDALAVFVRKSSEPPDAAEAGMIAVAPKGKKPGVMEVSTVEITAKVEAIDHKKRTVTVMGPEGNLVTLKVDKGVKKFDNVKKGDQVVLRHTEALLITVTKK